MPCYSSLSSTLSPPAVPIANYETPISIPLSTASSMSTGTPTFAVINVVYAAPFPLAPVQGLSTGVKAGIGTASSVAGIAIIALAFFLIMRSKKRKNNNKTHAPSHADGPGPITDQSQRVMSSILPYQHDQKPGSLVPQETYIHPQQTQQMQQIFSNQNSYNQQPVQQHQQGQVEPYVQYPNPPPHTVLSPPLLDARKNNQGGYPLPGSISASAVPSTGSQGPALQGYRYEHNYAPAQISRRPVPTSTASSPPLGQEHGHRHGHRYGVEA